MRIVVAAILGGVAMFIWTSVAHLVTPLGQTGLKPIPNEAAVMESLHASLGDAPGLYVFPFMAPGGSMKEHAGQLTTDAHGLLAYSGPSGGMSPAKLVIELVLELVEAGLLAVLAAGLGRGIGSRLGIALVVGAIAAITTNGSYWNWYGFSLPYTAAAAFTELVKYVVAGLVITAVLAFGRRRVVA